MENRRIDDLFEYMSLLIHLRDGDGGYICTREIGECISEIRSELKLTPCRTCNGSGYATSISEVIRHIPCGDCRGNGRK